MFSSYLYIDKSRTGLHSRSTIEKPARHFLKFTKNSLVCNLIHSLIFTFMLFQVFSILLAKLPLGGCGLELTIVQLDQCVVSAYNDLLN